MIEVLWVGNGWVGGWILTCVGRGDEVDLHVRLFLFGVGGWVGGLRWRGLGGWVVWVGWVVGAGGGGEGDLQASRQLTG